MLAKYYNVSLDYLAGLTNVKRPLPREQLSEQERQLIDAVRQLDDTEKDNLLTIAELISQCK